MAENGSIFSIDMLLAFLALLAIMHIGILNVSAVAGDAKGLTHLELEKNAIMAADSLVKNRNPEEPLYGAAVFDSMKRRTGNNRIDPKLLAGIGEIKDAPFVIKELSAISEKGTQRYFVQNQGHGNCLAVERLVIMEDEKTLLRMVLCSA